MSFPDPSACEGRTVRHPAAVPLLPLQVAPPGGQSFPGSQYGVAHQADYRYVDGRAEGGWVGCLLGLLDDESVLRFCDGVHLGPCLNSLCHC